MMALMQWRWIQYQSVFIKQRAPVSGISNVIREQAVLSSVLNFRKPGPDLRLPLLSWKYSSARS